MKRFVVGGIAALALDFVTPVQAASPAPVMTWTGFYVGGLLGVRAADSTWTTDCLQVGCFSGANFRLPQGNPASFDSTGFRGSIYFGYNWQVAPRWIAGIEGDIGLGSNNKSLSGIPGTWAPGTPAATIALDSSSVKETWDGSAASD